MPPAIVYTDMADLADAQVGIFTDKKFFIVQRVPQRSHYISLVESNGGHVVKLEAQADYLIADHMRHDAPAGSLSYKFIEEAIKQGQIPENESPFHANRRKSANPAAATASSKKSTRTPFTDDDDKLLYKWVQKAIDEGLAIQGNSLYQVLAAHNPRHTFHSWRDRYIKVLSLRAPPTGWEAYPDENLPPVDTPVADPSPTTLSSAALPRSTSRPASTPKSRAYTAYTEEDDQELRAWVIKKAKHGASISGNAIYQELEARNPRHTFHSWRDRWIRYLSLREPDEHDDNTPMDSERPDQADDDVTSARPSPTPRRTLSKRPSFRIPPGASASQLASPAIAPDSKSKGPRITPQAVATQEPTVDASSLPTASQSNISRSTASRTIVTSKNQANTPMVRTRNLSSPIMSQQSPAQPQSQRGQLMQSPSSSVHKAVQADIELQPHDDSTFTKDDFEELLSVALDIQNVCVGRYQESWIKWAKVDKSHTAIQWRSFYERRVLPVFLGREDDPERPVSQSSPQWAEFWRNQGQPIRVSPHMSTSEVQPTPRVAQAEKDGESARLGSAKRKLQDPQGAVEQEPAFKRTRTVTPPLASNKAPVQTKQDEVVSISSKRPVSVSHHSEKADEEEEEHSEDQAAGQLRREMAEDKDDRHQLTRANLARIQAENGLSEKRGVDIEEDNEDDDQGDFATYLANMLPPSMKDKALETIETHEHEDDDIDEGEDEDEDVLMNDNQHEPEYDPALLEMDPDLENPSYQSSAEFDSNNTNIHLDIPTTQAWEASSLPSQSQPQQYHRLSTQAIYETETQPFDADIPLPPDASYISEAQTSYHPAQSDSQILAEDEVWPWIDVQMSAGHDEGTVKEALRATSFNPKLAALVLDAKNKGEQVDAAGVWTEGDDQIAEGSDAKAIRQLEGKHGKGSVETRIKFLSDWRRDEEIANSGEVEGW